MLVGDDNGIEGANVFTDGGQTLRNFPAAEACINQDAGTAG